MRRRSCINEAPVRPDTSIEFFLESCVDLQYEFQLNLAKCQLETLKAAIYEGNFVDFPNDW